MNLRSLSIFLLVSIVLSVPAFASMTFYTGTGANVNYGTGLTASSLIPAGPYTFTGADLINNNDEYAAAGFDFFGFSNNSSTSPGPGTAFTISSTTLAAQTNTGAIEITLPTGVYAFALNLTVPSGFGIFCVGVGATDSNCSNQVVVSSGSDREFAGVISTDAISSVWIGTQNGTPAIANFQYATAPAGPQTPEVASMLLLGSGLVMIGLLKRRIRRPEAQPA